MKQYKKRFFQAQPAYTSDRVVTRGSGKYLPSNFIVNTVTTFFLSSLIALIRALEVPNIVSKCSFRSVFWVVESGVVSVHPDFPDWVANPCVGLSRILYSFTKDIQGLDSGPINNIGLSALAIHRAQTLSLFPWCTVAR